MLLVVFTTACQKEETEDIQPLEKKVISKALSSEDYSQYEGACSYPFRSVKMYSTSGESARKYTLTSDQQTDRKYTWRSSLSVVDDLKCRKFNMEITNDSDYPLVFRAVGVKSSWGSESYELLDGAYEILAHKTKTIRFDQYRLSDLYEWHSGMFFDYYDKKFVYINFEIIIKNRNEIKKDITNIPIKVNFNTWLVNE